MSGRAALAVVALILACQGSPCAGCGGDPVAELVTMQAVVERDFGDAKGRWSAAARGAHFEIGDGLRTGSESSAKLRLFPAGALRVESETVVRFSDVAPERRRQQIEVQTGAIEIESADIELGVRTPAGVARIAPGSRVRVGHEGGALRFAVQVGRVVLEGGEHEAAAGGGFVIDVGTLVVEPLEQANAAGISQGAADPDGEPDAAAAPSDTPRTAPAPGFDAPPADAHVSLPASESATIHDPGPPTHLQIDAGMCPEGAAIEVARGAGGYDHFRVKASGSGIVRLGPGSHRYRVRCYRGAELERKSAARGRIRVSRDSGTRRLPRTAAKVVVDVDGRRYTVRYQNRMPLLTFRWPGAPDASSYLLEIETARGRTRRERSAHPEVRLDSSSLGEGVHRMKFSAGDRTASGSLRLSFDNTARTAYLSSPRAAALSAGGEVTVAGAALSGSRVSVLGRQIPLRGQGRFSAQVALPGDVTALTVKVEHPATGIHYYLRRTR